MKKFHNHNPAFGDAGPFEAESKENLANEMKELFKQWAEETILHNIADYEGNINCEEDEIEREIKNEEKRIKEEFMSGLEEVFE